VAIINPKANNIGLAMKYSKNEVTLKPGIMKGVYS